MRANSQKATIPTARSVAARVVERVLHDKAFASAVLDAELERAAQLQPRDRRLATELAYGTLRVKPRLEARLARHAPRGLDKLDPATLGHLLVAAYQILLLDRIPAFAAVSEAVDNVRAARGEGLARFTNAVLRKLASEVKAQGHSSLPESVLASLPASLLARLSAALGSPQEAKSYVVSGPWPPPVCLRLRLGEERELWRTRLSEAAPEATIEYTRVSPFGLSLQGAGATNKLPGCGTHWILQEEGSQVIALALGTQPGDRILDACAGRGNKTTLLAEIAGSGRVEAADLHSSKLATLRKQVERFGATLGPTHTVDWSVGTAEIPEEFDRVLVDAPCSGIGTFRRRPDLLTRDLEASLPSLQQLQVAILSRAASRCRPGGRVVYSVCSVFREEAEQVLERVLAQCPWLEPAVFETQALRAVAGDATTLRILPHRHGTDGYFLASLRRSQDPPH